MARTKITISSVPATAEMYPDLQQAFDFFNEKLFLGRLPPCLITLQRVHATLGYFSPERYARFNGEVTHEIALGAQYFGSRTLKETLSTLCHEMVHLEQYAYGSPGRRGYHNHQWATWAENVGLIPSSTGQPGGQRVGEKMDHYIQPGGRFDRAADELLATGFRLRWVDRYLAELPFGALRPSLESAAAIGEQAGQGDLTIAEALEEQGVNDAAPVLGRLQERIMPPDPSLTGAAAVLEWPSDRPRSIPTRVKYRCPHPGCGALAWAKEGMEIKHMPCDRYMESVTQGYRKTADREQK